LNKVIDTKSNILIAINALISPFIFGTVMSQLSADFQLIYLVIMILFTNLISVNYAIFATLPKMIPRESETKNLMF
jgi:hypothetical protein